MAKLIKQTEPLFTVRPRSAENYFGPNKVAYSSKEFPDGRGPRSKIRLLPLDNLDKDGIDKRIFNELVGTVNGTKSTGWGDFLLTDVQCSMNEKVQIMEVFGDNFVSYFFGKSPTTFTIGGILIDDVDNEWFPNFLEVYDKFLRGTQLARKSVLLELSLPNVVVIGAITSFSYNQNANRDTDIPFTMQVVAKAVTPKPIDLPQVKPESVKDVLKFSSVNKFLDKNGINTIKAASNLTALVQAPTTSLASINKGISDLSTMYASGLSSAFSGGAPLIQTGGPVNNAVTNEFGQVNPIPLGQTPTIDSNVSYSTGVGPYSENKPGQDFSKITNGVGTLVNKLTLGGVSSTLTGFKSSIFSPVFGFLSSITKTVKAVTGDISKILLSFTSPVNSILRDINGVTSEVLKVVNLITSSINQLIGIPKKTINEITAMINGLKRAAGAITRIPISISSSVGELFTAARIKPGAAILKSGKGRKKNLPAIIRSGSVSYSGSITLPYTIRRLT